MNKSEVTRIAARILLLAALVGINAAPFFITNVNTSHETTFFALSAIHAELCLFTAWCIFVERRQRYARMFWSLLGMTAAVIAATRLLPGEWSSRVSLQAIMMGIGATFSAVLPMVVVFAAQKYSAGTEIDPNSVNDRNLSFRLKQLFVVIAVCAFLSLLLRQVIKSPNGWLLSADAVIRALIVSQSFVMGLLAAPCALVILKPNRFFVLWLIYFVAIAAAQPFLDGAVLELFKRKGTPNLGSPGWFEHYLTNVIDNIAWYGPQLLPTVVLFVVLRLTGVRVQDTK